MPGKVLLSDLVTRAKRAADQEYGGPVSTAEATERMKSAIAQLYDRLVHARGQDYYRSTRELNTIAGQANYAMPDDFYKILAVLGNRSAVLSTTGPGYSAGVFQSGTDSGDQEGWTLLRPFDVVELAGLFGRPASVPSETRYRLRGIQETSGTSEAQTGSDTLELRPVPRSSFTLRLEYLPLAYTTPDGSGDLLVNGINGFEDWCIFKVAIYCAQKEQSDTKDLREEFAAQEERIASMARSRDLGSPEKIVDSAGILSGWPGKPLGGGRWRGWWP